MSIHKFIMLYNLGLSSAKLWLNWLHQKIILTIWEMVIEFKCLEIKLPGKLLVHKAVLMHGGGLLFVTGTELGKFAKIYGGAKCLM